MMIGSPSNSGPFLTIFYRTYGKYSDNVQKALKLQEEGNPVDILGGYNHLIVVIMKITVRCVMKT